MSAEHSSPYMQSSITSGTVNLFKTLYYNQQPIFVIGIAFVKYILAVL